MIVCPVCRTSVQHYFSMAPSVIGWTCSCRLLAFSRFPSGDSYWAFHAPGRTLRLDHSGLVIQLDGESKYSKPAHWPGMVERAVHDALAYSVLNS